MLISEVGEREISHLHIPAPEIGWNASIGKLVETRSRRYYQLKLQQRETV